MNDCESNYTIIFLDIKTAYPVSHDITVSVKRAGEFKALYDDWIGLYRVGWTSYNQYCTSQRVLASEGERVYSVVFPGHSLPQEDGQLYQFCYMSRDNVQKGASSSFTFSSVLSTYSSASGFLIVDITDQGTQPLERKDVLGVVEDPDPMGNDSPYNDRSKNELAIQDFRTSDPSFEVKNDTNATHEIIPVDVSPSKMQTRDVLSVMRHRIEAIVELVSYKIDQMEERALQQEDQKDCGSNAEVQKLISRNIQLEGQLIEEQRLSEDKVALFRTKLQKEELLTAALQGELSAIKEELNVLKQSAVKDTKSNKDEAFSRMFNASTPSASQEALQIAYDNMEKYYRKACADLEECLVHRQKAESKAQHLGALCNELMLRVEQGKKEYDVKAAECVAIKRAIQRGTANSVTEAQFKTLELLVDEYKQKLSQTAIRTTEQVECYELKIKQLEQQLKEGKINYDQLKSKDFEEQLNSNQSVGELALSNQLKHLRKTVASLETERADLFAKCRKLENQLMIQEGKDPLKAPHNPIYLSALSSEFTRQCPLCLLSFPGRMIESEFERHIQSHSEGKSPSFTVQ